MPMEIMPIGPAHRALLAEHLCEGWGGAVIITRGRAVDASRLPGLLCMEAGQVLGIATYEITGDACELVTLDSLRGGLGIGTRLLGGVAEAARQTGCRRLWLVTTNDNTAAIRFYQRRGLTLAAAHIGAIARSRALKPQIPLLGIDNIPIRDELEFELWL